MIDQFGFNGMNSTFYFKSLVSIILLNCPNTETKEEEWYPKAKVETARQKLNLGNPAWILRQGLTQVRTLHNLTQLYTTLYTTLYNPFTTLYTTLHNLTQLYTTVHNFTQPNTT